MTRKKTPKMNGGSPATTEWQVQVRTVCLECGRGADDELCVGPFLSYLVVEFDRAEFRRDPLSDGSADFDAAKLPRVYDADDNDIPDHPILKALRGKLYG